MFSLMGVLACFLGVLFVLRLYRELSSPLRRVPGPFLARFTRLWELLIQRTGRFEEVNVNLHECYGPVVRLGPNRYSLASPASTKIIYGHGSQFPKTRFYDAFGGPNVAHDDNIFTTRSADRHSLYRRRIATLYTMSAIVGYEAAIDKTTRTLTANFEEFARRGQQIPMREWLQFYAYDVIGELTIGASFGIMDAGRDTGFLHAIDQSLVYGSQIGLVPEVHRILSKAAQWLQPFSRLMQESATLIEGSLKAQSDKKDAGQKNDYMSKLLVMMKEGKVERKDVDNSIGLNIGAGSDTTAISLSAVVLELLRHPDCLEKLRKEIDQMQSEGKLSDPVTFKEAQQMPYLQAVIKEALRVHPAVGQTLPRCVPAEGVQLDGYFFPGGTEVGVNAWVLHRNKDIFGADAELFRPERWLESKEASARMDQNSLAFGAGSRTCLGKNVSLLEMNKVIPQLFRTFDFELVHLAPHQNDWFVKQRFECRIKLRHS